MKYICTVAILLIAAFSLFSQADTLKQREVALSKMKGEAYVQAALQLSKDYYSNGFFEKSESLADDAFDEAKKNNLADVMAIALSYSGNALMKQSGKRSSIKAFKAFEDSNELTKDKALKEGNLLKMRELAQQLGKKKDLDKINSDLAVLNGRPAPAIAEPETKGGLFNRKKRAIQQKLNQAQVEKEMLAGELTELTEEQKALKEKQEELKEQQDYLQTLMLKKENAIQDMTEQQIRQQLIFWHFLFHH